MADQTVLGGLADAYAMMDALPDAAQKELARDLADIGGTILVAQQQQVPVATGALRSGLKVQLLLDQLKVRVGLIGVTARRSRKTNLGSLFYGVVVNFGRKAQTVLVTRHLARRVILGNGKTSKRRVQYLAGEAYPMKVRAMAPRDFIDVNGSVDAIVDSKLADFWARTFTSMPGVEA